MNRAEIKNNIKSVTPLLKVQEVILERLKENDKANEYLPQYILQIEGDIDRALFEQNWEISVSRHDILRSVLVKVNTKSPRVVILKKKELCFYYYDNSEIESIEKLKS